MTEFDYKNLTESLVNQAKNILENDAGFFETDIEYILSIMKKYTLIAAEGAVNDNSLNNDQKVWWTEVVAEWIYHKARDIVQARIAEEYHENIFQKFAYVIYQTITDGWKNEIEEQTILNNIEDNIVETNKNILKELLNRKFIDQDCYEFALSLSSIDEFCGTEQTNTKSWQEKYNELSEKYYQAIEIIKKLKSMIEPDKLKYLDFDLSVIDNINEKNHE